MVTGGVSPGAAGGIVTVAGPSLTVATAITAIDRLFLPVMVLSVFEASIRMSRLSTVGGVPEMTPVLGLKPSHGGRPKAQNAVGLFVATIWYENGTPTVATASSALVISGVLGSRTRVRWNSLCPSSSRTWISRSLLASVPQL